MKSEGDVADRSKEQPQSMVTLGEDDDNAAMLCVQSEGHVIANRPSRWFPFDSHHPSPHPLLLFPVRSMCMFGTILASFLF